LQLLKSFGAKLMTAAAPPVVPECT